MRDFRVDECKVSNDVGRKRDRNRKAGANPGVVPASPRTATFWHEKSKDSENPKF